MKKFLKKFISSFVVVMFVFMTGPVQLLAAGTTEPTGPRQPVGVVGPTGPQTSVGTLGETGVNSSLNNSVLTASNATTGPNSENRTNSSSASSTNVNIDNNSEINNNADITVDTGHNTIGSNTAAGSLVTGDANVGLNFINASNSVLNPNSTYASSNVMGGSNLSLGAPLNRISFENFLTGPDSENSNLIDINGTLAINEINNSDIDNEITVDINTGENQIRNNTKIGDLITGDINACINLLNLSNIIDPLLTLCIDSWNIIGDVDGNITFENSTTGPNSINTNELNISDSANIVTTNNSNIINDVSVNTNTGNNTFEQNTVLGNISTGVANVKESIVNIANVITSPVYYIFNIFGKFTGDLASIGLNPDYVFLNELTGPNSENNNITNQNNGSNISLENNSNIDNSIRINANTGRNFIGNNTMVGNVDTGSIDIGLNLINLSNIMGQGAKDFCIRIINIFGNWNCDEEDNEPCDDDKPCDDDDLPAGGVIVNPPTGNPREPLQQAVLGTQLSRFETPVIKSVALVQGEDLGNPPAAGPKDNQNELMYAFFILLTLAAAWTGFEILTYNKK